MNKKIIIIYLIIFYAFTLNAKKNEIHLGIEFTAHAAAPYIALYKKWFKKEGINIIKYDNYITGTALASALTRGDINVAYICLIPAISAYKNGGVKLKIVCGTHKYGYGLIVNSKKIKNIYDLQKKKIKIACGREGSPTDILLHKLIEKYNLKIATKKILRMSSPKILLLMRSGQIDGGFCCEQFVSMGVKVGFKELISAKDLWKNMQGSVLIVREELIKNNPTIVKKLVNITRKAILYLSQHQFNSYKIVAHSLSVSSQSIFPLKLINSLNQLVITPDSLHRALYKEMICTPDLKLSMIQDEINYMYKLGYIKNSFNARLITDLRFLK